MLPGAIAFTRTPLAPASLANSLAKWFTAAFAVPYVSGVPNAPNPAIELMKTTTLVAIVSYADLLFETNEVAQKTFRPLEVFTVTALIYFVVIFAASQLVHGLERRLATSGEGMAR